MAEPLTGRQYCRAKTRAGTPCRQPTGRSTDHVDQGRCKLHGGRSLRGRSHPNFRGGRYASHLDPEEQVQF